MNNSAYLQHEALKNKLLAALPRDEFARLLPDLEVVTLPLGKTVYEPNEPMDYVYFPTTSLISMLYTTIEGVTTEIGLHGSDGVVGLAVYLGGISMPHQAVVMIAGTAYRMKAYTVKQEFARNGYFQSLLLRFTLSLITQISQTAVCNRLHSVEQHFCRWLLETRDRLQSATFSATQEIVAKMLGVRREAISLAANRLQDENLIAYARGTITILDHARVEALACECYETARTEYNRLLDLSATMV